MHTGIDSPQGIWWTPAHGAERLWVAVAFAWCIVLFAMMPLWHLRGQQNPSGIRYKVEPTRYYQRVQEFINQYKVGEEAGIPIVAPPPGSDVYLLGQMWKWTPILKLQKGVEYGFNLNPVNVNFQVVPGYDYGLKVVPTEAGDFRIVCDEFCGIGHHIMVGKVIVTDSAGVTPATPGGAQ